MDTIRLQQKGSLLGAILLISGCCIGAGMLGLPVISAVAGFKPSLLMFLFSWLFMSTTALLLLEVNLWFSEDVSIISMAERTLGLPGKIVAWVCFLFLFYALGVAYISGSGELIATVIYESSGIEVPSWMGSLAVALVFGVFVYLGTFAVDYFNRALMLGLIISYVLLVALGIPYVKSENLNYENWSASTLVLPVMIISFGFHNLIPSLTTYLQRDAERLRWAVIAGSCLALIVYLVWQWLILGLVPHNFEGFSEIVDQGSMATDILKNAVGSSWILDVAQCFALFAILTSFLGNSLSFVDFLSDGLKIKKDALGKFLLCGLVVIPPFILALVYPRIFLLSLNYAGTFGALILFGILPALMAWRGRQKGYGTNALVPGGFWSLFAIISFAVWMILTQLIRR